MVLPKAFMFGVAGSLRHVVGPGEFASFGSREGIQ